MQNNNNKSIILKESIIGLIKGAIGIELDHSLLFSKFIIDLLPLQMQILVFVDKNEGRLIEIGSYKKFYDLFINDLIYVQLDIYDFKYSCNELENKVLISMGAGLDDFDSTSSLLAANDHKEATVKLTTIGKKFIEFLK